MSIETARKRAKRFFRFHHLSLPVDVETLLLKYADVEETYIQEEGDAICINKKRPHIFIKKNMSPYRKRFTYAHELGHIQIPTHLGMISCIAEMPEKLNCGEYDRMEQEADAFAAELLMPEDWLISIIDKFDSIDSLLNHIVDKAKVSDLAATYNLIRFLPAYYMFEIYNIIGGYCHYKYGSQGDSPILLYDNGLLDNWWMRFNCRSYERVQRDTLDLIIYKFKNLPSDDELKKIESSMYTYSSCQKICDKLVGSNKDSLAHILKYLLQSLHDGFVIKIKIIESGTYQYFYSKETYTQPTLKYEDELDFWFSDHSLYNISSHGNGIELNVWRIKSHFEMIQNYDDARDSKTILRDIIDKLYYDSAMRKSIIGQINGLIGGLNNSITKYNKQDFYNILKQKMMSKTEIESVTTDKDFDHFLCKKIEELYNKI